VIVVPAKTAKVEVVPRFTVGWAATLTAGIAIKKPSASAASDGTKYFPSVLRTGIASPSTLGLRLVLLFSFYARSRGWPPVSRRDALAECPANEASRGKHPG
jgi:hypothetical protein